MDTKGGKRRGWGRGGGGVMNWEIGIDMYTLMGIKWMTNKNLLYKKIKLNLKIFLKKDGIASEQMKQEAMIWTRPPIIEQPKDTEDRESPALSDKSHL